ncbi:MAG: hypothetical protein ACOCWZ_03330 [Spirochaetota bacterium]
MASGNENFEKEIEDKLKEYEKKINEYRKKAQSMDAEDEIHQHLDDLTQQQKRMQEDLDKMKNAEDYARTHLEKGIVEADDFFNTVMDKVAKRILPE